MYMLQCFHFVRYKFLDAPVVRLVSAYYPPPSLRSIVFMQIFLSFYPYDMISTDISISFDQFLSNSAMEIDNISELILFL